MKTHTASIRRLTVIALFAALMAVLSQISVPLGPIPFSCGILGALLCGLMLRPRDAVLAMLVYLLLGAAGLPVFAGFKAGLSAVTGMTGGYLLGYFLIAWLTAVAGQFVSGQDKRYAAAVILCAETVGVLACYAFGTAWFMFLSGNSLAAALSACVLPFLPGDALKILLAYMLAAVLKKRLSHAGLRLSF